VRVADAGLEGGGDARRTAAHADLRQHRGKVRLALLAVGQAQVEDARAELLPHLGLEDELGRPALDHGRQLQEVADHDQGDAPHGPLDLLPDGPRHLVEQVEEVGLEHGHLVDDEPLGCAPAQARALLVDARRNGVRRLGAQANAGKGVHRAAANLQRRDAGRGRDRRAPGTEPGEEVAQERALARARVAGDEDALVRVREHVVDDRALLGRERGRGRSALRRDNGRQDEGHPQRPLLLLLVGRQAMVARADKKRGYPEAASRTLDGPTAVLARHVRSPPVDARGRFGRRRQTLTRAGTGLGRGRRLALVRRHEVNQSGRFGASTLGLVLLGLVFVRDRVWRLALQGMMLVMHGNRRRC
jgi:hypothetical protein